MDLILRKQKIVRQLEESSNTIFITPMNPEICLRLGGPLNNICYIVLHQEKKNSGSD